MFDLVPLARGRRVTVMESRVSFERRCNSFFHSLFRTPFEPPPSDVMRSSRAPSYNVFPTVFHHLRMDSTANAAVSWSTPTFTKPLFLTTSYTPYGAAFPSARRVKS